MSVSSGSEFSILVDYYQKNKHRPWYEWLKFESTFGKQGKQGLVGLMKARDINSRYVFKMPQDINYLAEHEGNVLQGLNMIAPYCPHYCRIVGVIECDIDPINRKRGNPFALVSKYTIKKHVLLCEYIDESVKLSTYLRSSKVNHDAVYATIKQTLMAITIAQRHKFFTHYDLHSSNIMVRKCSRDLVFLYVLDEQNQFAVPTHGQYPVIIDPGFAYIEDLDDGPLWMSLGHTDGGFMSDRFDWVADPKLFMVTISGELDEELKTKKAKKLRRVIKNIFSPLTIDWYSGHDKQKDKTAVADFLMNMLTQFSNISKLFDDKGHFCIDILQTLIISPLEPQSFSKIDIAYRTFIKEWMKIETAVTNQFFTLYILKGVIDAARYVRAAYKDIDTQRSAVTDFKHLVWKTIDKVAKFCRPKDLNLETLLCSLLVLARCMEGVLYRLLASRMAEKEAEYSKLPLDSTEKIYGAIEANIGENYIYSATTHVCVLDCVNKTTKLIPLSSDNADTMNQVHFMSAGSILYDIYTKTI